MVVIEQMDLPLFMIPNSMHIIILDIYWNMSLNLDLEEEQSFQREKVAERDGRKLNPN